MELQPGPACGQPPTVRLNLLRTLSAEGIPEAAEALRTDLVEMLPRTQIASLLIEIDR